MVSEIAIENMDFAQELSDTFIFFIGEPRITDVNPVQPQKQSSLWAIILVCMYSAYVLMLLTGWIRSIIRARKFLRGKNRRRVSRTVWLVTHDEAFGPFSWMNYIVISDTESGFARRASLRHEYSHIRLLHSVDLVFLLACTILNPVCWLVLQEIKIVHEYEADNEVINRYGIRNSDYQKLLIMRTVGAEAYALASSFNLNIKKRIIMMNKNKTRKRRLMWLLILLPLLGMTSVLFARTEKSIGPDDMLNLSLSNDKDSKENVEAQSVNQLLKKVKITGKIVNENGDPIKSAILGIAVSETTTTINAQSDSNGKFALLATQGDIIVIEKQGYLPIKISADEFTSELTITLHSVAPKPVDATTANIMTAAELEEKMEMPPVTDPEFPGGWDSMMQYLNRNVRYPAECRDNSIQGSVLVSFIINKDGEIVEAEVVRSVHPLLDAEALRVVNDMPNWVPGTVQGKPVRFRYSVPVNFVLYDNKPSNAQWIYIYDVNLEIRPDDNNEIDDYVISALLSSSNSDINDLEIFKTPQIKSLMEAYKSAQSEAKAMHESYTMELNEMQKELDAMFANFESKRKSLTESQMESLNQEMMEFNEKIRKRYQELQKEFTDWNSKKTQSLQPLIEAAWKVISESGTYVCAILPELLPNEDLIVSPNNLESALDELFESYRAAIFIKYSDDNYQQVRALLSQKYPNKAVFFTNIK